MTLRQIRPPKEGCTYVIDNDGCYGDIICRRKRGFGPNELYCKQHGKMMEARNELNESLDTRPSGG